MPYATDIEFLLEVAECRSGYTLRTESVKYPFMKIFSCLLVCFFPILLWGQPNYDSLAWELIYHKGFTHVVSKEIDTVQLIQKLLENYGDDNCLNQTWGGDTDYEDTFQRMVSSSSNRVSEYGLTINRISAMYLISALFYSDTLFTKEIALYTNQKGEIKYIDGVMVLFPKERPYNTTVIGVKSCNIYGKYKTKLLNVKLLNKAVDLYRRWFILLKMHGLNYLRENNIFPLKDSEIFWKTKK